MEPTVGKGHGQEQQDTAAEGIVHARQRDVSAKEMRASACFRPMSELAPVTGSPVRQKREQGMTHTYMTLGRRLLAVCLIAAAFGRASGQFNLKPGEGWLALHPREHVFDTTEIRMHQKSTEVDEDTLHLIDLNSFIHPYYTGCSNPDRLPEYSNRPCGIIVRETMDAAYYITKLPDVGQLFQAYRPPSLMQCTVKYPTSCRDCCGSNTFSIANPDGTTTKTCCNAVSDYGTRLFNVGEEIKTTPSKVWAHAVHGHFLTAALRHMI